MKLRKLTAVLAAATMMAAPTVAAAAPAAIPADMRASAPISDSSELRGNRQGSMIIGLALLIVLIAIALSRGNNPGVASSP